MNKAFNIVVEGRVQGVGFRYSTLQIASRLKLTGWVKNEPDRSVKIYCEGPSKQIEAFLKWLKKGGPPYCKISSIEAIKSLPNGNLKSFEIKF